LAAVMEVLGESIVPMPEAFMFSVFATTFAPLSVDASPKVS
jgi:hypothetical protein